ncbi:hypothetical protein pb186bvf_015613 [Paramecium bursaria]
MGNCCIKAQEKKKGNSFDKEFEQTVDFKHTKQQIAINVASSELYLSDCQILVSTCDTCGRNPNNKLLIKNKGVQIALQKLNLEIGEIAEVKFDGKYYLFLLLPLYLGEDKQIDIFKSLLYKLCKKLIEINAESLAIEDLGVYNFGYPRQLVASNIVEIMSKNSSSITSLKRVDFVSAQPIFKILFEKEIKGRQQQFQNTGQTRSESFEQERDNK